MAPDAPEMPMTTSPMIQIQWLSHLASCSLPNTEKLRMKRLFGVGKWKFHKTRKMFEHPEWWGKEHIMIL